MGRCTVRRAERQQRRQRLSVAACVAAQPPLAPQLVAIIRAVFLLVNVAAFLMLGTSRVPAGPGPEVGLLAGMFLRDRVRAGLIRIAVLITAGAGRQEWFSWGS